MSVWQAENEHFLHLYWVEGTFCLDSGNVIKSIVLPILSGYLESVLQVPQAHRFSIFEA